MGMARTQNYPELWGGVECTVNRVGDRFHDQLELNGHAWRVEDLDLFATLGIRAMRYPVLWERTAPHDPAVADWSWADERLGRLLKLGIRPIVGLLHHGSGPRGTSLVDPEFPERFARYARAVAGRYPWVEAYTPINEPLTTARFSGLYGLWYPHGRTDRVFVRALLNQCRATALAMREIRSINPDAKLVQTEDLGKTYSTEVLTYQANFENHRRWLTFDLLAGRVVRSHPLWRYLWRSGASRPELEWFLEHPTPPDIIGINHYVTSERFLDHRLDRYPQHTHGGNHRHRYADLEAVRVRAEGVGGPETMLREAWERYGLPIAVTEAHLGCTREQQLRWIREVWEAACTLRGEGADLRAVTAWSLLGAYDWNSLLTRNDGHYEPGVFDIRTGTPRATAIAPMLRNLAGDGTQPHPAVEGPGWWRCRERLLFPSVSCPDRACVNEGEHEEEPGDRPVLIAGAAGTLGRAFALACTRRKLRCVALGRDEMDIADPRSVEQALERYQPWGIINAAGYVRVDDAERDTDRCIRENVTGPTMLAGICSREGLPLLNFSSDLVFDGGRDIPYLESDETSPLGVYGRSKAEAEQCVLHRHPEALVVRTSAFFGPWDDYNFLTNVLRALSAGTRFDAAKDLIVSPTYVPDLVDASLDLLIDGESGIWHLANGGATSWYDFARRAAELSRADVSRINPVPAQRLRLRAPRPRYSALGSERGRMMPPLEDAIKRYLHESSRQRSLAPC